MRFPKPARRSRKPPRPIRRKRSPAMLRREMRHGETDPDSWQVVVQFYGFRCAMGCGRYWEERGHVRAVTRGGSDDCSNLFPVCHACNVEQGKRTVYPPRRHPWMEGA